jgi:hypothetical protein
LRSERTTEIPFPEYLIHYRSHPVNILVSDLYEDGASLGHQISRHSQAIPQIRQVAVNPIAPSITKRPHLLRLTGDVLDVAVLHIPARSRPLEI